MSGWQVKGLVSRLDELESELDGERSQRGKAEKSRHLLGREIEELTGRLEESGEKPSSHITPCTLNHSSPHPPFTTPRNTRCPTSPLR